MKPRPFGHREQTSRCEQIGGREKTGRCEQIGGREKTGRRKQMQAADLLAIQPPPTELGRRFYFAASKQTPPRSFGFFSSIELQTAMAAAATDSHADALSPLSPALAPPAPADDQQPELLSAASPAASTETSEALVQLKQLAGVPDLRLRVTGDRKVALIDADDTRLSGRAASVGRAAPVPCAASEFFFSI